MVDASLHFMRGNKCKEIQQVLLVYNYLPHLIPSMPTGAFILDLCPRASFAMTGGVVFWAQFGRWQLTVVAAEGTFVSHWVMMVLGVTRCHH